MHIDELKQALDAANSVNNVYARIEGKVDAIAQYILEIVPEVTSINFVDMAADVEQLKATVARFDDALNGAELEDEDTDPEGIERLRADIDEIRGFLNLRQGDFSANPILAPADASTGETSEPAETPSAEATPAEGPEVPASGEFLCVIEDCDHAAAGHGYKTWAGLVKHAEDKHDASAQWAGPDGHVVFVQAAEGE
jgi:hypothetical protein